MIKILIAERNLTSSVSLANALAQENNFKIIYQARNEKDTYKQYIETTPDVVILSDNIISNNNNNILNQLHAHNLSQHSNIILYASARPLTGKTNKIYSIYKDCPSLDQLSNDILCIHNNNQKPNCKNMITNILCQLGFNLSNNGTQFLIDIVLYLYNNNISCYNIKDIYNILAQKHSTSYKKIKWNIENSVNSMCQYCNKDIRTIFPDYDDERKLSPKYLINLLLSKLP